MKDTKAALIWIVDILNKHAIPFQIGGGFAAYVYGAKRAIHDIDIALPTNKLELLLPEVREYIIHDLKEHKDSHWEFTGMTLEYKGQEIDLVGAQAKRYLDEKTQTWIVSENDFSTSEFREIYGITVPLMAKEQLIAYKKKLGREVDIADVKALEQD
jgi:predicted nucleotidyltransferase